MVDLVVVATGVCLVVLYGWLRFGPKCCPNCGTRTMGVWGPPIGIRRMFFRCKACGTRFEGRRRLPL
jgi:tRNA(Ile2) C34 agmatinyltransferase TiaS